jgi:hypothetical protein
MNATDIIGWAYEADLHCEMCAEARFPVLATDPGAPCEDSEGNDVYPIVACDEHPAEGEWCGTCGACIWEPAEPEEEEEEEESGHDAPRKF